MQEQEQEKPIDKVTVDLLVAVMAAAGVRVEGELVDKIIDAVELIEDKGDAITLSDIFTLKENWKANSLLDGFGKLETVKADWLCRNRL